jgi:ankyrin repeat protein
MGISREHKFSLTELQNAKTFLVPIRSFRLSYLLSTLFVTILISCKPSEPIPHPEPNCPEAQKKTELIDLQGSDEQGDTALHRAIKNRDAVAVQALIAAGASVIDRDAVGLPAIDLLLLETRAEYYMHFPSYSSPDCTDYSCRREGRCCSDGLDDAWPLPFVEDLYRRGLRPANSTVTAVLYSSHPSIVQWLLAHNIPMTPDQMLLAGAILGNRTLVEQALRSGANVNTPLIDFTPLYIAVAERHRHLVPLLLNHGANPNAAVYYGPAPNYFQVLIEAIDSHQNDIVRLLLARGADPDHFFDLGYGPVHPLLTAQFASNDEAFDMLIAKGAKTVLIKDGSDQIRLLHYALRDRNVKAVNRLIKLGVPPSNKEKVQIGVLREDRNMIQSALKAIPPQERWSLIEYAIRYGSVNTARYLLTAQRLEPDQLREAVHIAIERDERSMLDAVRSAGWRADDHDCDYLLQAMDKPHSLAWLLSHGVKPEDDILDKAIEYGPVQSVLSLIEAGAKADQGVNGPTSLHLASSDHLTDAEKLSVAMKLKGRMEALQYDSFRRTELHFLAKRGEIQTALWFIKHGVQINARNSDGETALHVAAKHRQREFVKMLLNQGADAKIEDCKGNSAPIALD